MTREGHETVVLIGVTASCIGGFLYLVTMVTNCQTAQDAGLQKTKQVCLQSNRSAAECAMVNR